jgi:choice-of-anchor C domain-containing protein
MAPPLDPPAEVPAVQAPPETASQDAPPVNLLVNGSFEEGPYVDDWGVPLDPGSTAMPGWVVTHGQIDYITNLWNAADGGRSLDLNGSPGVGGVAQTFATRAGQRYRVTFALAGNPTGDVTLMSLAVSAAGQSQAFTFDTTGMSDDNMGWEDTTWEFVATGDQTTLEIYSADGSNPWGGPALDNVSVVAVP